HLLPADPEVARDIVDDRPLDQHRRVVPAGAVPDGVANAVEPVASQVGEVDTADERLQAVDNHELLVMTVHRPLTAIGRGTNARTVSKLGDHRFDLAPAGPEQG